MRILIISYYFPPYNSSAAVRVGKTAKYLAKFGHDVKVITADGQGWPNDLACEIPRQNIYYTKWISLQKPLEILFGKRGKLSEKSMERIREGGFRHFLKSTIYPIYKAILYFPDPLVGWLPYAVKESKRLFEKWKPDIIMASAPPFTSHLIASRLSRKYKIPWMAEFRNLWIDNQCYEYPGWRKSLESKMERRTLSSAIAFITLSEPFGRALSHKYKQPVSIILSGYDTDDYAAENNSISNSRDLQIIYTGNVYAGKQDPSPLFEALSSMGEKADDISVLFYGRQFGETRELAKKFGIEHLVKLNGQIPYRESMVTQKSADILLLLLWNDPKEQGVNPGKLFEYIGTGRPILAIGNDNDVAAELIRNRNLGEVIQKPTQIAAQLAMWLGKKRKFGFIGETVQESRKGLSREEQIRKQESFIAEILEKLNGSLA